jgi:hypothetical protein
VATSRWWVNGMIAEAYSEREGYGRQGSWWWFIRLGNWETCSSVHR